MLAGLYFLENCSSSGEEAVNLFSCQTLQDFFRFIRDNQRHRANVRDVQGRPQHRTISDTDHKFIEIYTN